MSYVKGYGETMDEVESEREAALKELYACHRCRGRGCDPFEPDEPCLRCGATGIEPSPEELKKNFG